MLRNSFNSAYATEVILGSAVGLLAAVSTIALALNSSPSTSDVLAILFMGWMAGWILGPLFTGGEKNDLRPEHFALMPMTVKTMAKGIFGASFFSIGSVITLIALLGLIIYSARLGVGAMLVAIVMIPAMLTLMVLASRVAIALLGETMRSRLGAVLAAIPWAVIIACASNFGILLLVLGQSQMLHGEWPAWLPVLLRALPSGWGIAAVEAAYQFNWLVVIGLLLAFLAVSMTLLLVWSKLLSRRITGVLSTRVIRPRVTRRPLLGWLPATPIGAILGKELRTWSRDMMRTYFWFFALWFSVAYTILPVFAGLTAYLPWAGVALVVIAAAYSANLYSADGSALWLTLMAPGVERADIRGRQIAWLIVTTPLALALTIIGVSVDGQSWTWPLALGILASSIGMGAGFLALLSVLAPIRMPDAHRRSANPATDSGNLMGLVWAMIGVSVAAALPVAAVVVMGLLQNDLVLQWLSVPLGVSIGSVCFWFFGRLAYRRLETNGPELLEKLRGGNPNLHWKPDAAQAVSVDPPGAKNMRFTIGLCMGSGWIPIGSGIISLFLISQGGVSATWWTLPTRLPEPLPIPVAIMLIGLGLFIYMIGVRTLLKLYRLRRELRQAAKAAAA